MTKFYVDDVVISNNKAQQGSAFYLESKSLSYDSYIRTTTFANNESAERGALLLYFSGGTIEIADNKFEDNLGVESCISISINANVDIAPSYAKIQNNTFKGNSGIMLSLLENIRMGHLQLEQNVSTHNSGQALVIRHGHVTDINSIYEYHVAERGSGVTIMKDSVYSGTDITFDSNEAYTQGGVVFATTQSTFACSSCTFTNNKAEKGGAVYVESSSRAEITSSTFEDNIATQNGSAYYMTMSKIEPLSFIKSSTFTENHVANFGTIFLIEASI